MAPLLFTRGLKPKATKGAGSALDYCSDQMSDVEFSLSIAGIGVVVRCSDALLAAELQQRYLEFPAADVAQLTAEVHLTGQLRTTALLDTGTTFHDGVLHFTAPGYEGFIDEKAGEAQLRLSSAQPLEDVDYLLRVAYALLALRAGGLLFHAAGIVRRGRGYLFFGHSGSGKTTVARLSLGDLVLNDDLVLLMPKGQRWVVHATPFWNPSQIRPTCRSAPLAAMFRLVQDREVYLEEMGRGEALAELVANVPVIPADPARSHKLLEVGRRLLRQVPIYRLHFLPDASFWRVVESSVGR